MTISGIVRISTQGVSRPYVCQDEDGRLVWCKGNHTGLKAIMSEWLCARIAQTVDLPVPECHIAKLAPSFFKAWCTCNEGMQPELVTNANPYVFASRNVEGAKDVIDVETDLREMDALLPAKIFLFDAFIRNTDRTDYNSNLLVNHGLHVIDHNNAFDPAFDRTDFERTHVFRSWLHRIPVNAAISFQRDLRDVVTSSFLDAVWSEMPAAWTDAGESVFSVEMVKEILLRECK